MICFILWSGVAQAYLLSIYILLYTIRAGEGKDQTGRIIGPPCTFFMSISPMFYSLFCIVLLFSSVLERERGWTERGRVFSSGRFGLLIDPFLFPHFKVTTMIPLFTTYSYTFTYIHTTTLLAHHEFC